MTSCGPSAGRSGTSDLDAFLDLLCADEELLRAEFEAIVAAEWPRPPDRRAVVRTAARGDGRRPGSRPEPDAPTERVAVDRAPRRRRVGPATVASGPLTDLGPSSAVGPAPSWVPGPRHRRGRRCPRAGDRPVRRAGRRTGRHPGTDLERLPPAGTPAPPRPAERCRPDDSPADAIASDLDRVLSAYAVLRDPDRRADHDRLRRRTARRPRLHRSRPRRSHGGAPVVPTTTDPGRPGRVAARRGRRGHPRLTQVTGRPAHSLRRAAPRRLLATPGWFLLMAASVALLTAAVAAPVLFLRAASDAALREELRTVEADAFASTSSGLRGSWTGVMTAPEHGHRAARPGPAARLRPADRVGAGHRGHDQPRRQRRGHLRRHGDRGDAVLPGRRHRGPRPRRHRTAGHLARPGGRRDPRRRGRRPGLRRARPGRSPADPAAGCAPRSPGCSTGPPARRCRRPWPGPRVARRDLPWNPDRPGCGTPVALADRATFGRLALGSARQPLWTADLDLADDLSPAAGAADLPRRAAAGRARLRRVHPASRPPPARPSRSRPGCSWPPACRTSSPGRGRPPPRHGTSPARSSVRVSRSVPSWCARPRCCSAGAGAARST